jgi:RNA ligase
MQARGLIMKDSGEVVARPFIKFFNIGERPSTQPKYLPWSKGYTIWEKLDGSCGNGYQKNGKWHLATPGSFVSDQAIKGTEMLNSMRYAPELLPDRVTPIFEIVYPDNRVVVDYDKEEFLTLLAIFEHDGEEWPHQRVTDYANRCGFRRPRQFQFELDRDTEIPFEEDLREGYVIRFENGKRVKAKDPRYVKAHRLLEHMSVKGVMALMREGDYGVHISALPKELQKGFDDIRARIQQVYDIVNYRAYEYFDAIPGNFDSRKDVALWIQSNIPSGYWGMMFGLLDSKDIVEQTWKETIRELAEDGQEDS